MEEKVIIGYQGTANSNNHRAAIQLAEKLALPNVELRPLITGKNVVAALQSGEIRYGAYAYSTEAAGLVRENVEATKGVSLKTVGSVSIDIHHHLFKKNASVPNDSITAIVSHPEALWECRHNAKKLYPNAEYISAANTGVAARALYEGELPETTAVICNEKLGAQFDLAYIRENFEDLEHNGTIFILVELA